MRTTSKAVYLFQDRSNFVGDHRTGNCYYHSGKLIHDHFISFHILSEWLLAEAQVDEQEGINGREFFGKRWTNRNENLIEGL
jgi:hypothetical protein